MRQTSANVISFMVRFALLANESARAGATVGNEMVTGHTCFAIPLFHVTH